MMVHGVITALGELLQPSGNYYSLQGIITALGGIITTLRELLQSWGIITALGEFEVRLGCIVRLSPEGRRWGEGKGRKGERCCGLFKILILNILIFKVLCYGTFV